MPRVKMISRANYNYFDRWPKEHTYTRERKKKKTTKRLLQTFRINCLYIYAIWVTALQITVFISWKFVTINFAYSSAIDTLFNRQTATLLGKKLHVRACDRHIIKRLCIYSHLIAEIFMNLFVMMYNRSCCADCVFFLHNLCYGSQWFTPA